MGSIIGSAGVLAYCVALDPAFYGHHIALCEYFLFASVVFKSNNIPWLNEGTACIIPKFHSKPNATGFIRTSFRAKRWTVSNKRGEKQHS